MTDIERKALALAIETRVDDRYRLCPDPTLTFGLWEALCRAIEQHEAFRQEVSDAVEWVVNSTYMPAPSEHKLRRFIIAKPDPLVEAMNDSLDRLGAFERDEADRLRAAIEKRGGKITWGEG